MEQEQLEGDDIFLVHDLVSARWCADLIDETEEEGYEVAPVNTDVGSVLIPEYRHNLRVMLDREDWADSLWAQMQALSFPFEEGLTPVGLNERFRFYRYDPGHFFSEHYDGAFVRGLDESRFTILVFLSDGFQGGETAFGDRALAVTPKAGMGLFFRHEAISKRAHVQLKASDSPFRWN